MVKDKIIERDGRRFLKLATVGGFVQIETEIEADESTSHRQTETKSGRLSDEKPKTPKELGLILLRQAKERRLAGRR